MESLKFFLAKRLIVGILVAIALLWAVNAVIDQKLTSMGTDLHSPESTAAPTEPSAQSLSVAHDEENATEVIPHGGEEHPESVFPPPTTPAMIAEAPAETPSHGAASMSSWEETDTAMETEHEAAHVTENVAAHETETVELHGEASEIERVKGTAFLDAVIEPLDYELNERFYRWQPNDIINVADNVKNYQRGVLEVTRRTVRVLTERISRTGNTVAFNTHLENAMNWLMVKADAYWFPSPEAKYQEALDELELYKQSLESGEESFFTRADNIIPLLQVFEDLLGSCEENLVKKVEKDGSKVSFFASDDYFFYSKGVAETMHTILEAVEEDFGATIESRKGTEDLKSAIESLHHAYEINPLIILNSDPDSLWANHRANMAAPISHAKFYIGVLITTLST